MVVPLKWYPSCLTRRPLKRDIPNKNQPYTVYMGLIIKGPFPTIFPKILGRLKDAGDPIMIWKFKNYEQNVNSA